MRKSQNILICVLILAAVSLFAVGCGGGGSSSMNTNPSTSGSAAVSGDNYIVYGTSGAARVAAAGTSSSLVVLPEGATRPTGMSPVPGATINFTDSNGNVVSLTTGADGRFNPNDLGTTGKSSDPTKGKAIMNAAQTDVTKQPTITVMPPSAGSFNKNKPIDCDVSIAPASTGTVEIAVLKIVPDVKKVVSGTTIMLNALGVNSRGMVTRPPQVVTWTATNGSCVSPPDKSFICIYTAPAVGGSVTITASTTSTAGGTAISANAVLDVIDATSLFTLSGTVFQSDGTTPYASAAVNFDIPPAAGKPPMHIVTLTSSTGLYSILLPPNATFTVAIGSPINGPEARPERPPTISQATPSVVSSGAAAGAGTQNFTTSATPSKPPAPPPSVEQYITHTFWDLRDVLDRSMTDVDNGLRQILYSTPTTGIINNGMFRGWTFTRTSSGSTSTWKVVEPTPPTMGMGPGMMPHRMVVVTASAPITPYGPTNMRAIGTFQFTSYMNGESDVRNSNGIIEVSGTWTDNLTLTQTANGISVSGTVNGTIRQFSPDNQTVPRRVVTQIWTLVSNAATIESSTRTGDTNTLISSFTINRSAHIDSCTNNSCFVVTLSTPTSTFIKHYGYTSDGTVNEFDTTLTGGFRNDGSATFDLTNATVGDAQLGAVIEFNWPPMPTTPNPNPDAMRISGSIKDKDGNVVATFTIDNRNQCSITKNSGTPNPPITKMQL